MKEMSSGDIFAGKLKNIVETDTDSRFAFFIGAGCSVTSGIPTAGGLTKLWLDRLLDTNKIKKKKDIRAWINKNFENYDEDNPALSYGAVMEELFPRPMGRQREIERLVEGKDPSDGYAMLAQLITHERFGRQFNVVLTTNFDDLLNDALYLYPNKKALVIVHETLAHFVRVSTLKPLIVKLHGDARLDPKNLDIETSKISRKIAKKSKDLLADVGLVFIGYGGNDKSIVKLLNELDDSALPGEIFWINTKKPGPDLTDWLEKKKATWVHHRSFDTLMEMISKEFKIKPIKTRFAK